MEKRISYDQFQSVKRVAQACNPLAVKRDKIRAKIEALAAEFKDYDTQISSLEAGIKQVVGFRVEELVKKVIESGVDINGQPKKTTKWLPTDIVSYDEKHKQYVIVTPDVEEANTAVDEGKDPVEVTEATETVETPAEATEEPTEEPTSESVETNESVF
jgi:hypothetical protein